MISTDEAEPEHTVLKKIVILEVIMGLILLILLSGFLVPEGTIQLVLQLGTTQRIQLHKFILSSHP